MSGRARSLAVAVFVGASCFVLVSCAHSPARQQRGVPVDSRPTPPQPPAEPTRPSSGTSSETAPAPAPAPQVESAMTPQQRREALGRIVADTTAASAAVRKCSQRKLLPDQESVFDTATSLLAQTRAALARAEVWNAESLARKARTLAASLDCP